MEVEYIRGSENTIADLLSRMVFRAVDPPTEQPKRVKEKSDLPKICPVEAGPDPLGLTRRTLATRLSRTQILVFTR